MNRLIRNRKQAARVARERAVVARLAVSWAHFYAEGKKYHAQEIQDDIKWIKRDIKTLRSRFWGRKSFFKTLESNVNSCQRNVDDTKAQICEINKRINDMKKALNTNEKFLSDLVNILHHYDRPSLFNTGLIVSFSRELRILIEKSDLEKKQEENSIKLWGWIQQQEKIIKETQHNLTRYTNELNIAKNKRAKERKELLLCRRELREEKKKHSEKVDELRRVSVIKDEYMANLQQKKALAEQKESEAQSLKDRAAQVEACLYSSVSWTRISGRKFFNLIGV